ncbi:helix-turn-helix transcriptional regulator [Azonexus sp.]|jgi:transcriptional regulator with XRE-family HTH domain|uniref:helix-turn-helix domain-containing protein n=1 Tax=Azonexus sp. TaxID=1872668 RepID=UPI002830917A|nr:helix-turn-helix transcriptional regulator [Azonexus sp.]MDR1995638.1 helix-turn-helix domain-containing protein [Azonexus sp.]
MSPFSVILRGFRLARGFTQNELALRLGYEPSYISALERSEKGPPRQDFIQRLIRGLELNDTERANLAKALADSKRQISLPPKASEEEYQLIRALELQLGHLHPIQIQFINLALSLGNPSSEGCCSDYRAISAARLGG